MDWMSMKDDMQTSSGADDHDDPYGCKHRNIHRVTTYDSSELRAVLLSAPSSSIPSSSSSSTKSLACVVDREPGPDRSRALGLRPRACSSLLAIEPKLSFEGRFFQCRFAASFLGIS